MKDISRFKINKEENVGLVLSGGGSRGAYHIGVIQYLADQRIQIDAVSGASIGALNGALIAAEVDLVSAAKRLHEIWFILMNDGPSKLGININAYLSLKILGEVANSLGVDILKELIKLPNLQNADISIFNQKYIYNILEKYASIEKISNGLPLYVSVYKSQGVFNDLSSVLLATLNLKNTPPSEFFNIQSLEPSEQHNMILASASLPLIFEAKNGFSDGGIGSFIDSQGNTPAYPLIHHQGCTHIIVTHLDNGSFWNRYKYDSESSNVSLIEIRPRENMNREGWKDLVNFNEESINFWIEQGYKDAERCLKKTAEAVILHRTAQEAHEKKMQALEELDMTDFSID